MRYSSIKNNDIANGIGIRVSLFVQGCTFKCPECFNTSTHDFNGGNPFDSKMMDYLLELCSPDYIEGLSVLGGEPLHPNNRDEVARICKAFKERFPNKTIWIWSGFKYEDIKDLEVFKYVDVLVDGLFKIDLKNISLKWRGSSNQRVIDIKQSRNTNGIELYCD